MTRRKIREGNLWLRRMDGESDQGVVIPEWETVLSISECMHELCGHQRLCVEVERIGEQYFMRCYPRYRSGERSALQVATAYAGLSLSSISNAAVQDHLKMAAGEAIMELQSREHLRWVAS